MIRFFIALLAAAFTIYAVALFAAPVRPSFLGETLILLVFTTGLIYVYLHKAATPGFFVMLYLASMVLKLLAYGAYVTIIVLKDKPGAVENVTLFLVTYLIFTVLEVGFLYVRISRGRDQ